MMEFQSNGAFIPVGAPVHRRRLSRLEIALAARRNVLEIIPAISYRQPIVTGEMLRRWHMLADPGGYEAGDAGQSRQLSQIRNHAPHAAGPPLAKACSMPMAPNGNGSARRWRRSSPIAMWWRWPRR